MGRKIKFFIFLLLIFIPNLFSDGYKEGEVIVKYKEILSKNLTKKGEQIYPNFYVEKNYQYLSTKIGSSILLLKSNTLKTSEMIEILKNNPNVDKINPNYKRNFFVIPNDPYFSQQWGLHNTGQSVRGIVGTFDCDIDAPEAWDITTGSQNIVIAVIDTGIDYNHPDLFANMWINNNEIPNNGIDDDGNGYIDDYYGYNFVDENGNPMDDFGHGTHVAGIIGAVGNNGIGVTGVNWNCKIMALKAGSGYGLFLSDILEAIEYVIMMKEKGENIVAINASYGGYFYSDIEEMVINEAGKAGIVFCAAAGNDGTNNDISPVYPASYDLPNIISVAASDQNDNLAYFSNYGILSVDLCAPGVNILSTYPNSTYAYLNGTSMACPFVTGAVGIISNFYPGYTVNQKIQKILSSVDKIQSLDGIVKTGGRLNLFNILTIYYYEMTGDVFYLKNRNIYKKSLATNRITPLTYNQNIFSYNLSEDGEKIIFSDGTFLYSINSDGSGLENLSVKYNLNQHTKNQKYGIISSDGKNLVFVAESLNPSISGENLYLKELTGQKRLLQLTFNSWIVSYPCFIDDSTLIFKARNIYDPLEDFYTISINGINLRNITNNNQYSPYFPRIGRPILTFRKNQIVYAKQVCNNGFYNDWEIYSIDISTGLESKILSGLYFSEKPENQKDPMPILVGDNQLIFYGEDPLTGEYAIFITNIGSTNPYSKKIDVSDALPFTYYLIPFPKPTQIIYIKDGQLFKKIDNIIVKLTDTLNQNFDPSFDITGTYITFAGNGIWFGKSDGTDLIQIEKFFDARYPAISPDRKWVIYVKENDIYALRTDLSLSPQRITYTPNIAKIDLSFSPDGKKILYSGQTNSGFQVFYIPITIFDTFIRVDGNPVNLTNYPGSENFNPKFTFEGEYIYFVSNREGERGVYKMRKDGTECVKIDIPQTNPSYPIPSPYGKEEIIYTSGGNIFKYNIEKKFYEILVKEGIYEKIDWAVYTPKRIETKRQFPFKIVDSSVDFTYIISINVNPLNPPTSIILQEIIPSSWRFISAEFEGVALPPDYNYNGIVKWLLTGNKIKSGILKIRVSPGNTDIFNGGFYEGLNYWTTKGDSYIRTGIPVIPFDFNEDFKISDEELLTAIDYWAKNERYNGWPDDIKKWDEYLLKIINFWISINGYEYIGNYDWRQK